MARALARDAAETDCAADSPEAVATAITTSRNDTNLRFMRAFYRNGEARPSPLARALLNSLAGRHGPQGG
jgi:hypothetical protein